MNIDFSESRRYIAAHWPALVALLLAGMFAGRQIGNWPIMLQYPGEQHRVEGISVADMVRLREGVPVYAEPTRGTFQAANYGPLYFLLGSRLINPLEPAYLPIRLVSVVATLLSAAICGVLAFWLSRKFLVGVLASLLFLSAPFVTRHGVSARPDLGALTLWLGGFLVGYRFRDNRKILWAIPLMVAGFFYKQQFIAAGVATFLFLLLERRYRQAAEFAGIFALSAGILITVFHFVVFPGQTFVQHFLFYNIFPFTLWRAARGLGYFGVLILIPLLLGIMCVRARGDKMLGCFIGTAGFLNLVLSARIGSDTNYFLESFAILSALAAVTMWDRGGDPVRAGSCLGLLAVGLALSLSLAPPLPDGRDFAADQAIQNFLRSKFRKHTKAFGFYTGDLMRAGFDTPITDTFAYRHFLRMGRIPEADPLWEFEHGSFGLIITYSDVRTTSTEARTEFALTEPLRRALLQNYQLLTILDLPKLEMVEPSDRFHAWVPSAPRPGNDGR
jgi:hypothetical protein